MNRVIDKLAFEGMRPRLPVIANQCAHWCGNPPERGEMCRIVPGKVGVAAIFGGNRYLVPLDRGIATTSVRTGLAMTGNLEAKPANTNLSFRFCARVVYHTRPYKSSRN